MLQDAKTFTKLISTINELMEMAEFEVGSAGMKLSAMDSNSVTIISLSLASHAFKRYRCDRTLKLGVKVESLKKIMDTASSHDNGPAGPHGG